MSTPLAFSTVKYTGTTPGADSNTYVIFATTLPVSPGASGITQSSDPMNANRFNAWAESSPALMGFRKVSVTMKMDKLGTLNLYESIDRGTTWRQVDTIAVAAPASTASFLTDFLVEGMRDFKIEWVNGGTAQTFFDVVIAFSSERASPL